MLAVGILCSGLLAQAQLAPYGILNRDTTTTEETQGESTDSSVQLTADTQGLSLVTPDQIPFSGTFWTIMPGFQSPLPYPCPVVGETLPTYALPDGSYLVDDTFTTNAVTQADLEAQAATVIALIDQANANVANAQPHNMARMSDDISFPGSGGGTNIYTPDDLTNDFVMDYGTNLWLEITNISGVWVNLLVSNTVAGVEYEIDGTTNLAPGDWNFEAFFYGSELTNWTPATINGFTRTNNLFLRVKSWADDGSGMPFWWQLQFFGYVGVDPNADPMGDGWSNIQKFQLGWNPNIFYTPAAPQGLTVTLNQAAYTAAISWLPSPGAVTDYTVEKNNGTTGTTQDITLAASATNYTDNVAGDDNATNYPYVTNYTLSYRILANYTNANQSAWSPYVPLQQTTVSAAIIPGANGTTFLAVSGIPAGATTIQFDFIDEGAEDFGDSSDNYLEDIPVSAVTNGLYQVPESWLPASDGYFDFPDYNIFIQSVDANGNPSAPQFFNAGVGWPTAPYNWGTPFYDGRVQLKQNLIFQLRAAAEDGPLHFYYSPNNGYYYYSTNYAYSGLYQYANANLLEFDAFLPFEENYIFRNFVFNQGDVNNNGQLTTGLQEDYYYFNPLYVQLVGPLTYQFETNLIDAPALLATNATRFLFYDLYDYSDGVYGVDLVNATNIGSSGTQITMTNDAVNWFGLPYLSVNIAGQSYFTGNLVTNVLSAGDSETSVNFQEPNVVYTETAQPRFQTIGYDFWNSSDIYSVSLPGASNFSPTNQSQLLMTTLGNPYFQVAGYAKIEVTNAFPGVYGYLGQYFDQAYQTDTNGVATTNTTGVLSPYGNFFATQPGQEALVTMPDIDTGERGTCMVYVVSLQLDKNHDGVMDTNYYGSDYTTTNSPFVFWCNNNYDRSEYDLDDKTNYEDDVLPQGTLYTPVFTPDCNYTDQFGNRNIPTRRDLEDFARLWICGVNSNLLASLPIGSSVTLSWGMLATRIRMTPPLTCLRQQTLTVALVISPTKPRPYSRLIYWCLLTLNA
jgi:hypothetical protein